MELLGVVLVALFVLAPLAAIGLALAASSRAGRLAVEVKELRARLERLDRRLRGAQADPASDQVRAGRPEGTRVEPDLAAGGAAAATPHEPLASGLDSPGSAFDRSEPPPLPTGLPAGLPAARATPSANVAREAATAREADPKPKGLDLESLLGGSLLVWIGGVALALAAAFLVKYSLEQGFLGPGMRVGIGVAFGLILIGAGEWLRLRSARVAQAACAAGIAALFAALLAGTNLYALIPPVLGFAALALTTAATVVLSLRHGPFVAGLGLLGGFLTPALIRMGEPSPPLVFGYLFALQLGLLQVARRRGWWPLGILALLGTHAWAAAYLFGLPARPEGAWLGLFILAATATAMLSGFGAAARESWGEAFGRPAAPFIGWIGGTLGLLLTSAVVHAAGFSNMEWGFLFLLAAGGLVLARLDASYLPLPWLTAAAGFVLLLDWSDAGIPLASRFVLIALAYGGLHALGAWLLGGRSRVEAPWAAISAASTVAYFLVAWHALPDPPGLVPWGFVALGLCGLHAGAFVLRLHGSEARGAEAGREGSGAEAALADPGAEAALAAHAVAATVLLSLAFAMELEREWIAVALALEVALLAWLDDRLALRCLRILGGAVAVICAVLLLLNPAVLTYPIGELPVLNWLLWGYGLPCAAFAVAALLFRRRADDDLVRGLEVGACAFAAAWFALELRHLFHGSELDADSWSLAELGWLSAGWLLGGGLLALAARRAARPAVLAAGCALGALGLAVAIMGPVLLSNPLWSRTEVAGPRVLNTLLIAYLLPALLAGAWGWLLRAFERHAAATFASAAALVLAFTFLSLEVRHCFHHPRLDVGQAGSLELYAYSAAWILMGVALLVGGLRFSSKALRQAALAVMLVAVAKVFLLDMRELEDLWRVLSFLGLGVSLLALGHLYQRFVLRVS